MRVWSCIVTTVAKIQEKKEKITLWHLSKNSVTRVVFLGGIRALVKVPQLDREFSFGNWLSKISTPKDLVEKIENHRALLLVLVALMDTWICALLCQGAMIFHFFKKIFRRTYFWESVTERKIPVQLWNLQQGSYTPQEHHPSDRMFGQMPKCDFFFFLLYFCNSGYYTW